MTDVGLFSSAITMPSTVRPHKRASDFLFLHANIHSFCFSHALSVKKMSKKGSVELPIHQLSSFFAKMRSKTLHFAK